MQATSKMASARRQTEGIKVAIVIQKKTCSKIGRTMCSRETYRITTAEKTTGREAAWRTLILFLIKKREGHRSDLLVGTSRETQSIFPKRRPFQVGRCPCPLMVVCRGCALRQQFSESSFCKMVQYMMDRGRIKQYI
jgi:hypothetical protein